MNVEDVEGALDDLRSPTVERRLNAVAALGALGDDITLAALRDAMHDPIAEVAAAAADALSRRGPQGVEELKIAVQDTAINEFGRREAVMTLRDTRDPDTLLCVLLQEEQGWVVRSEAALALAALGEMRAIKPLTRLVSHAREEIRTASVEALARLGGSAARAALKDASMNDPNRGVRKAARVALRGMTETDQPNSEVS